MRVKTVLLTQPNYAWMNKRTWRYPPYTLCLLKACTDPLFDVSVFDPNFNNLGEEDVVRFLRRTKPDVVGITSISTEYFGIARLFSALVRKALPDAIIVFGGVIPTVLIEEATKDPNVDYWIVGEGEASFPKLLTELNKPKPELDGIGGLAYWRNGRLVAQPNQFIRDLDAIPYPDYSNVLGTADGQKVSLQDYGSVLFKYVPGMLARKYPFAVTLSSRGCPYKCVFCAAKTVTGTKVRFRSAENVLAEIDHLYAQGIREILFLDDHFLADKRRAAAIVNGLLERQYDLTWKCANVAIWTLDEDLLQSMFRSGCNLLAVSLESGSQHVLDRIIKKPVKLAKVPHILRLAKSIGFYVTANFVIGFPGETWDQIRDSVRFAECPDIDIVSFHIATPLPKTELLEMCQRENLLPADYLERISEYSGYGKGLISTKEYVPMELEIVRAFEWDRINFGSPEKRETAMALYGITAEELEDWRRNTRRNLGVNGLVMNVLKAQETVGVVN